MTASTQQVRSQRCCDVYDVKALFETDVIFKTVAYSYVLTGSLPKNGRIEIRAKTLTFLELSLD